MKEYDAIVIGSGPCGMTTALYLARSGVTVALIEKLSAGGLVLLTDKIENYPGFPDGVSGFDLVDKFSDQIAPYENIDRINDEVNSFSQEGKAHIVHCEENTYCAKAIVICSGAKYKKLGAKGEEEYLGRGVSYCALCDANFYKGQEVVVVGGGNAALEEALYLARVCKKVHIVHRRDEFRALAVYQKKCEEHEQIEFHKSFAVEEIKGDASGVVGVDIKSLKDGSVKHIPAPGVFIFVGYDPVISFIPKNLTHTTNGIEVDAKMQTNIAGIFAAGDVLNKLCRQIATAVGDGATAGFFAYSYLELYDEK